MEQIYKDFEKTIKTKHSFRWTPRYKDSLQTTIKVELVTELAAKVFEKLDWDVVHKDNESAEARRKNKFGTWTEKIIVKVLPGNRIEVESTTLGNEMWDLGRNSKRVKLFLYAFQSAEREYDILRQQELESEIQRRDNWEDYVVPDSLTPPRPGMEPTFAIPAIGGLVISVLSAFLIAYASVNGIYVIGLFESIVGFAFGLTLKYLLRLGNYTDMEKLTYLIYAMIGVFFVANQIFQFEILIAKNNINDASFADYIKFRLQNGLTIKSLNTGWIGLVISWIFQILIIYAITHLRTVSALVVFQMDRIPSDVVEFACYHFIKGKSEREVRQELYKMGWTEERTQTEVIDSLGAIRDRQEIIRTVY